MPVHAHRIGLHSCALSRGAPHGAQWGLLPSKHARARPARVFRLGREGVMKAGVGGDEAQQTQTSSCRSRAGPQTLRSRSSGWSGPLRGEAALPSTNPSLLKTRGRDLGWMVLEEPMGAGGWDSVLGWGPPWPLIGWPGGGACAGRSRAAGNDGSAEGGSRGAAGQVCGLHHPRVGCTWERGSSAGL